MKRIKMKSKAQEGAAMVPVLGVMILLSVAAASYVDTSNSNMRVAQRQVQEIQTTHIAEAGVQELLRNLWRNFKTSQSFADMETACMGASLGSPRAALSGTLPNVGAYAASVIGFEQPGGDTYTRFVTVRAVGWVDRNNNGALDAGEPRKVVDVMSRFSLRRSEVFDYTYFVNNYGWMDGFNQNNLIINGDVRANANFNFLNGSPTVNGSVYAASNDKLTPAAIGLVNTPPVKQTNAAYGTAAATNARMRQMYNPAVHGAKGTAEYEMWRDFVFDTDGGIVGDRTSGAIIGDATGLKSWTRTTSAQAAVTQVLDTRPTDEIIMPDLSDLNRYIQISQSWVDDKPTFGDGTPNPKFGQTAKVEVWNTSTNSYQRLDVNGVVTGSAALVGTLANPIKIHGPVTFTQDCVIKGYVEGQGTLYAGRNVHIVGSVRYKNGPDFRGTNPETIDNANEKKDVLGLAARGSVIMGNTTQFNDTYPLKYMTPPFTKGRYDDLGNWIPPFNAKEVDYTGKMRYQSTFSNAYMNSISESVNVIDAILYTNFVGGGNIGTGGGGVTFNGSIISKDEAMVVYSLPMRQNYDNRIRERSSDQKPLIDIVLPRSPTLFRSTWQDRGFSSGGY